MSTITVPIPLSLETLLQAVEQLTLCDLEKFVAQVLFLQAERRGISLSQAETELLRESDRPLPAMIQKRYDELKAKRHAELLTPDEHRELLGLLDQLKKIEEKRLEYLGELARLHGISLAELINQLGIKLSEAL
jgi:hypothetical protein